jgi:hypothetical protein
VIVWLWEAGDRYSGITDDPGCARETAAGLLRRGDAARVEMAMAWLGAGGYAVYHRTGEGWKAFRPWRDPVAWEPLAIAPARRVAS